MAKNQTQKKRDIKKQEEYITTKSKMDKSIINGFIIFTLSNNNNYLYLYVWIFFKNMKEK